MPPCCYTRGHFLWGASLLAEVYPLNVVYLNVVSKINEATPHEGDSLIKCLSECFTPLYGCGRV